MERRGRGGDVEKRQPSFSSLAAFPPRIETCSSAVKSGVCSTVSTGVALAIGKPKSVPMTIWLAPAAVTRFRTFCGL
jgi:hypothetical protein